MNGDGCLVAVDVGNTAVKLAVRRGDKTKYTKLISDLTISISGDNWVQDAMAWVRDQAECRETHWRIASVQRDAAERLANAIGNDKNVMLVGHRDVPMKVQVRSPERLGIDRLLSAYEAHNLYHGPLIVADAGSAVTVDYVDAQGTFCGGAILPGISLQLQSLARGTDLLPHVRLGDESTKLEIPGKETVEAIRLGVIMSVAGAIDRLVSLYQNQPDLPAESALLVVTGGDATTLASYIQEPHEVEPNLVCRGLLDLTSNTGETPDPAVMLE